MRVFSTFSGIGGFEVGIDRAYGKCSAEQQGLRIIRDSAYTQYCWRRQESPVIIGFSEIDKYAIKVYERHFPNVKNYGDITKINADELPDFDCLVGGFPCQAFSIAGKRRGFNDTRGTLFFDLARILRAKRPRLFVFENVKGLLSHEGGDTFKTIIATIDELGYDCQWQVLNSKNHGVPQNRERIIIVGHLRGTPRPEVFPITGDAGEDSWTTGEVSATLRARYPADWNGNYVKVPEATKKGYAEATVGQAINLAVPNSKTRRGRVSDIANTIDTQQQQHTLTPEMRIRRLTPIECERLQAFPDNWTQYAADGTEISDTQRYKMCGNAVTTNVIQAVFEKIFESEAV